MILFPNCKVNIGLRVIKKRSDGYHDIETVMIPAPWHDILEIVPSRSGETTLTVTGRKIECPIEKNLVYKAYKALDRRAELPSVDIYLRKVIPDGAGLGGGSADAAFTLKGLNELFKLGFTDEQLAEIAAEIGADCPFFIYNRPMLATETGTTLQPIEVPQLAGLTMVIAKPGVSVTTREAYGNIVPFDSEISLADELERPIEEWQSGGVKNDFETTVFALYPQIRNVKETMIKSGAIYSSMTGSGAAVVGFFSTVKMAEQAAESLADCDIHIAKVI